mgnify:CR=1 FL=1
MGKNLNKIDKQEMQKAIEENDENKIYFFFRKISKSFPWKHPDIEDWQAISVARAFRYLPSYTKDRGLAFSYFYRIIMMEMRYQYRKDKKYPSSSELDDNIAYEQDFGDTETYAQYGDIIIDKEAIANLWNTTKGCYSTKSRYLKQFVRENYGKE